MRLDQFVRVTPGFKASINLMTDLDSAASVGAYIPTRFACGLLDEVAGGIPEGATNRSFLVHGAYGTGKSHLALTVASFLGAAWNKGTLGPVMEKLAGIAPEVADRMTRSRDVLAAPFLVVPIQGSEAPTRDALLVALDEALSREGLTHVMPDTSFHAAIERIEAFRRDYPDSVSDMLRAFQEVGYSSVEAMVKALRQFNREALRAFATTHPSFSRGARADLTLSQRPEEVYRAVSKALQQSAGRDRRSGILVIWDEFGLHLEQVLEDPGQRAYVDLQNFAEACSGSGADRLFFLGLAHRSIEQTVSLMQGLPPNQREVLVRIAGRFIQRRVMAEPGEQFSLLSRVLLPVDPVATDRFWQERGEWTRAIAHEVRAMNLFRELPEATVENVVVRQTFPLHPITTFLLPVISEKVAQNDRTLFHFMSDNGPDGLRGFIGLQPVEGDGRPNLLTADRLFDFFSPTIAASRQDEVKLAWTRFRKVAPQQDPMRKRVLQGVLLLAVANRSELRPTPAVIAAMLGLGSVTDSFEALLDEMRREKLLRRTPTGEYEFRNLDGEVDLMDALETAIADVPTKMDLAPFWERWAPKAKVGDSIQATAHNDTYAINRAYAGEIAMLSTLKDSRYAEQGAPREKDGVAYWVIPTGDQELEDAHSKARTFTNARVLTVLPSTVPTVLPLIRRYVALVNLQRRMPQAFGQGGGQNEEWENERKQTEGEITERLRRAFNHPVVYLKGNPFRCLSMMQVEELASQGMDETFSTSVRIPHERLMDMVGADSQKANRVAVEQALLNSPLDQVADLPVKPVAFIVDAVLKQTGWLRQVGGKWVLGRPDEQAYPSSASLWDRIESYLISQVKKPATFRFLLDELMGPPFGLRPRTLPVLLAAVIREHQASITWIGSDKPVDLSPDLIEKLIKDPGTTHFVYAAMTFEQRWVLEEMINAFGLFFGLNEAAPLRHAEKAITRFMGKLPALAHRSQRVSEVTKRIRDQVLIPIATAGAENDDRLLRRYFFETVPQLCGLPVLKGANLSAIKATVGTAFAELAQELKALFEASVCPVLAEVFQASSPAVQDIKQSIQDFIKRADQKPRNLLAVSQMAFLDATRKLAVDPMKNLDALAPALGQAVSQQWVDEDLLTIKVKAHLIREQIDQLQVPVQPAPPTQPPVEVPDPIEKAPSPVVGLGQPPRKPEPPKCDVAVEQKGGGSTEPQTPTPIPVPLVGNPAPKQLHITLGPKSVVMGVGGGLPPAVKFALNGVRTALEGYRLSKEDQVRVLAETLAELLTTKQ